ncbi:unnamed protein product [Pleuronectes platessa]|uniref:Uncharacterized protein n=1 Tax=Pleuronectes platessa TaxID=8262 RepID=A0A9N7TIQ8_PLEPL|nr:unnamed protein product [Pleuronectes platessa]
MRGAHQARRTRFSEGERAERERKQLCKPRQREGRGQEWIARGREQGSREPALGLASAGSSEMRYEEWTDRANRRAIAVTAGRVAEMEYECARRVAKPGHAKAAWMGRASELARGGIKPGRIGQRAVQCEARAKDVGGSAVNRRRETGT